MFFLWLPTWKQLLSCSHRHARAPSAGSLQAYGAHGHSQAASRSSLMLSLPWANILYQPMPGAEDTHVNKPHRGLQIHRSHISFWKMLLTLNTHLVPGDERQAMGFQRSVVSLCREELPSFYSVSKPRSLLEDKEPPSIDTGKASTSAEAQREAWAELVEPRRREKMGDKRVQARTGPASLILSREDQDLLL